MPSQVGLAESRRSRVNVIGAPRETLVTNVGEFGIPNRLLKNLPYPVFRMAAFFRRFTQRVNHATAPLSKDSPDGVSSRAVCIFRLLQQSIAGLPWTSGANIVLVDLLTSTQKNR
jgi:hypothetical protein